MQQIEATHFPGSAIPCVLLLLWIVLSLGLSGNEIQMQDLRFGQNGEVLAVANRMKIGIGH